jgi:hypothetical protein
MAPTGFAAWLMTAPFWLIAILLLGTMIGASLVGWYIRHRQEAAEAASGAAEGQEAYIVSAVLGLQALLLGFTFSLAIDRFDARRSLVVEEANAIGTAFLRTQVLEQPHRKAIGDILVAYTDNRIELAGLTPGGGAAHMQANDKLVADLWRATLAAFPTIRSLDFSTGYLDSINTVINLDASRKAARTAQVPAEVFLVLFFYVAMSAGVMGYVLVGPNGRSLAAFLFFLSAVSLLLIVDIDRPTSGGITESQGAMLRLRDSFEINYAQPPGEQPMGDPGIEP